MPDITVTSADGTRLAARRSGRGSPIVLVHGAIGDLDTFALVEGLFAERHSVWVYSRRGRGGSGDGPDYAVQCEVEDVLAVLAATGDRAHLVGHSGGAAYCLLAAVQSPFLRSLVLYEPPLRLDRLDLSVIDDVQSALDAGNADALELLFHRRRRSRGADPPVAGGGVGEGTHRRPPLPPRDPGRPPGGTRLADRF